MSGGIGEIDSGSDDNAVLDTESNILNEVEQITGENFDGSDNADEPTQENEEENHQADEDKPRRRQDAREAARSRDDSQYQRVDRREVQSRIPSQRRVDYDYDRNTGDVIDPRTGETIFKNGTVEREMFSQLQDANYNLHRMQSQATEVINRFNQVNQQLEGYKKASQAIQDAGVNIEQQAAAVSWMAQYNKNPVSALRAMLNQAQQDGVDLSDIFDNLPSIQRDGLFAELKARIDSLAKPQEEQQAQEAKQREILERSNKEITTFFNAYPEAMPHAELMGHVIQRATQRGQQMSLHDAYIHLQKFARDNNLDLNGDLREQLESQPRGRDEMPRRRPTPPQGRPGNYRPSRNAGKPDYERSSKDLVREAFEESGIPLYS